MSNLNRTTLIGRVGGDPAIKTWQDGSKSASFTMATSMRWKNQQGEPQEKTEWHNIAVSGKLVELVEKYVKKGDLLFLEGRNQTRKYTDKDNIERNFHEIVVSGFEGSIRLLQPKPQQQEQPNPYQQPQPQQPKPQPAFQQGVPQYGLPPSDIQPPPPEDDLPF